MNQQAKQVDIVFNIIRNMLRNIVKVCWIKVYWAKGFT